MKIVKTETTKRGVETIVQIGNKQFLRIKTNRFTQKNMNSVQIIEWKRMKTNNLVGASENEKLEAEFKKIDTTEAKKPPYDYSDKTVSGWTVMHSFISSPEKDKTDIAHDRVKEQAKKLLLESPNNLLHVVKYVKDKTGYGLKESKDIVDALRVQLESDKKYKEVKEKMFSTKK